MITHNECSLPHRLLPPCCIAAGVSPINTKYQHQIYIILYKHGINYNAYCSIDTYKCYTGYIKTLKMINLWLGSHNVNLSYNTF